VIGIDIDQPAVDKFTAQIVKSELSEQVKALNCSLANMDFPNESFDIIWSEGYIHAIGFVKGLREWKRFLKPCGYNLLGSFLLSKEICWIEYFAPLEKLITKAQTRYFNDLNVLEEIQQAQ